MRHDVALAALSILAVAAQQGPFGVRGHDLPAGRPFPWTELVATVITISLLLWAAHLRREE